MDAAYEADDLLSELDYYRLEQQVDDSEDEDLHRKVDYRLQKASTSSTPPSFHDINKATIVRRIHQIVSRLEDLVNCLSEALSLLEPEEGLRANPNVLPVWSHPLTTTFFLSDKGNPFEELVESESLSLFKKSAFGGEDPGDHLELDEIAKQIAGKLDGSLLAAKIVGGLLRDNLDEQHWRSVLCSDIWQQPKRPDDIMPILRFSYHHLPAQLQLCFAHCGFFPKNWEFKKVDLVGMWISQGYIYTKSGGNMSPEEIGSEYFDHLVSKSFIQASNQSMTSETFVLHELLHDLAEFVLEDEFLRINSNGTTKFTSRVRHIYVHANHLSLLKNCNLRNLRTLIIHGSSGDDNNVLKEVLDGLKSIRVLSLKNVSVQHLLGSTGHLIHLRYLTVRASYLNMPPDSQCRPYHLQWLIIETDSKGPTHFVLPAAMNCLVSLRHLKTGIVKMSGIGKLTHLQELESFTVGKKEGEKFGELKRLNELRGTLKLLHIHNASTTEEAFEANLNKKVGIRKLLLDCGQEHESPQMAEEVFEGLHPPPYIRKLTLSCYGGVKSPSWMRTEDCCLFYLQYLCLMYSYSWKVLPTLGMLPLLKHLNIHVAPSVEEIGSSFYGSGVAKAFPCLDTLEFADMKELVVWSGIELKNTSEWVVSSGGKEVCPVFPHLRELNVTDCPKLQQVPIQHMASVELLTTNCLLLLKELENLTSLKNLLIRDSGEVESLPVLPAWLVTLEIDKCPQLVSLFTAQTEVRMSKLTSLRELVIVWCGQLVSAELKSCPSLEKLHITSCGRIQSVPLLPPTLECLEISSLKMLTAFSMEQEENLSDLTSLITISIYNCPCLSSLPIMPASLQELSIEKCPELRRERYQRGGDDWHKISHVPTIDWY